MITRNEGIASVTSFCKEERGAGTPILFNVFMKNNLILVPTNYVELHTQIKIVINLHAFSIQGTGILYGRNCNNTNSIYTHVN